MEARQGVRGVRKSVVSRTALERQAREGDSPVGDNMLARDRHLSSAGHEKSRVNLRRPCRKAKYFLATDSEPVP